MAPYILLPLPGTAPMTVPRQGKSLTYAEPGAYGVGRNFRNRVGQDLWSRQLDDRRIEVLVPDAPDVVSALGLDRVTVLAACVPSVGQEELSSEFLGRGQERAFRFPVGAIAIRVACPSYRLYVQRTSAAAVEFFVKGPGNGEERASFRVKGLPSWTRMSSKLRR